jgi:hypothetical protein
MSRLGLSSPNDLKDSLIPSFLGIIVERSATAFSMSGKRVCFYSTTRPLSSLGCTKFFGRLQAEGALGLREVK